MAVVLLALPALRADEPKKDPDKSPKEQFQALVSDFNSQRSKMIPDINKAKGEVQQKLIQIYMSLGKDFADKIFKIAEDNPKDPVAADAIFWVLQNGNGSKAYDKASEKVLAMVSELPLKDLAAKLRNVRVSDQKVLTALVERAEKEEKDPASATLLTMAAQAGYYLPIGEKAISLLIEKHGDSPAIEQVCSLLSRGGSPKASDQLKTILEKNPKVSVKAAAALALGQVLSAKTDSLGDKPEEADKVAAEAEKYFAMVIDQYAKDDAAKKKSAERELKVLRTLRVGKEAPDIKAGDLDEKEFKLSDYRGKVVLLDFWGNW